MRESITLFAQVASVHRRFFSRRFCLLGLTGLDIGLLLLSLACLFLGPGWAEIQWDVVVVGSGYDLGVLLALDLLALQAGFALRFGLLLLTAEQGAQAVDGLI
jgi:hypothetical protein